MFERSRKGERALLIQPYAFGQKDPSLLEEFAELAASAGAQVVGSLMARIDKVSPSTLLGSGKVEEALNMAAAFDADLILINHTLSPVQERNLERILERRVVDRTGLILDIFAQRARSHEGKLQVELAQLKHMSTRLVRGWTHLDSQAGGAIGLRGPGETQLETDRRLLAKRVDTLKARLAKVEVQRDQMRRARMRSGVARVALVGYTNAGKSTLFNALTGADAYEADQLFATLDSTVRKMQAASSGEILISDTVGFVRDLPHDLVAAFRSTLAEARDADLLLHVVDAADPLRDERIGQVDEVLQEIGAGEIPQLLVFNKIDLLDEASPRTDLSETGEPARVWLSAHTGAGVDSLRAALASRLSNERVTARVRLSPLAGRLRARLFEVGAITHEQSDEDGWQVDLDMPLTVARQVLDGSDPDSVALRGQLLAAS